jgi:hypothetical protein
MSRAGLISQESKTLAIVWFSPSQPGIGFDFMKKQNKVKSGLGRRAFPDL